MKIRQVIPKKKSNDSNGSDKRHPIDRHKCYFTIKSITRDKDIDAVIKCKPPTAKADKSAGFKKTLYQLKGDEPPEKFVLWVKAMYNKVVTNAAKLDWELVFTSLVDLSNKTANAIIRTTLNEFSNTKMDWPNCRPIWDKASQRKLLEIITKSDGILMSATDRQAAWDAFLKKPKDCIPFFLEWMLI